MAIIPHSTSLADIYRTRRSGGFQITWKLDGSWRVALSDILQGKHGRKAGTYVYVVRDPESVVYVGRTARSIHKRLCGHMRDESRLGRMLLFMEPRFDGWSVEVGSISGDLNACERYLIHVYRPLINEAGLLVPRVGRTADRPIKL